MHKKKNALFPIVLFSFVLLSCAGPSKQTVSKVQVQEGPPAGWSKDERKVSGKGGNDSSTKENKKEKLPSSVKEVTPELTPEKTPSPAISTTLSRKDYIRTRFPGKKVIFPDEIQVPLKKPEYKLGVDDVISVLVWNQPDLNIPNVTVRRDGIKAIREISFEDLVVRDEVHLNQEKIARYLRQKRVLVTGAGGSVGSELIRQICRFHPQAVALVEMNELNLYRMEMECRQRFSYVNVANYLVDIRRKEALDRTFREFKPQVVFHAAAYKHVPIQERYPWEAVYNNVIGTRNMVETTLEAGVNRFVLVSSDKAVRPANVMGASKRLAEMMIECIDGSSKTRFMAVRFGNVIGSSGSVIPLFQEQIARGGPVTVTHPDIIRYFMSVSEAAQLILQAGAMGKGGEIFILDMGKPVRILDMARDLIRLHGYEPEADIPIQFVGLRPGEKLYEELITEGEGIVNTSHRKIMVLRGNHTWDRKILDDHINELLGVTRKYDGLSIKQKLQELVSDYTPQI